jgi:hypothetical protein
MKFVSTEEKENVGKRRRTTKPDYRRQTAVAKRPFRSELSPVHRKYRYRDKVFHNDNPSDSISIRINGYRTSGHLWDDGQKPTPRQESSESMLLDGDECVPHELIRPRRESLAEHEKPSTQASVVDLSSENTVTLASAHSCQAAVTTKVPSYFFIDNTEDHRTPNEPATAISMAEFQPSTNGSLSSTSQGSQLPVLHRFTLDDQVLAERKNELQKSMSSVGPRSISDSHMHKPLSHTSPELLFRSGDYSESHLVIADGLINSENDRRPVKSFANNQTGSDLCQERQRDAIDFFATPNRRRPIQDTTPARAEWNIHDRSASKDRISSAIFFGQPIPQNLHVEPEEIHAPSMCSSRLEEQRSQRVTGEHSPREQLQGLHMATTRFDRSPSIYESRNLPLPSSAHSDNANCCDYDREFTGNIHCHPKQTRILCFNQNTNTMSPVIRDQSIKERRQREYHTESSSRLPSASPAQFRFPAYWTPQQEQLRTSVPSAAAISVGESVSSEERMQTSPVPHPPPSSPFHSPLISRSRPFILLESRRNDYGQELGPDAIRHLDNNNDDNLSCEPGTDSTTPPFFNAPFRR